MCVFYEWSASRFFDLWHELSITSSRTPTSQIQICCFSPKEVCHKPCSLPHLSSILRELKKTTTMMQTCTYTLILASPKFNKLETPKVNNKRQNIGALFRLQSPSASFYQFTLNCATYPKKHFKEHYLEWKVYDYYKVTTMLSVYFPSS